MYQHVARRSWRQSHVQDNKLVSIRPPAVTGRIDHVGGYLSAADQAMYRLFNEGR